MGAVEGLSKLIAWIIVTAIKIVVYPIYIIADIISRVCKGILDSISDKKEIEFEECD
ncbi:hypothetical protein [Clostridium sp.]|uniref:hypothetical protein n=1 Tax=Clostridium sp. TaxID=1506 RepID=UPI00155B23F4|nr:hypothetical protein [Clostridium sp.]MBS5886799.1 hypothetical protein [Clostridium sp.]